jgi:hypothetical protein
MCRVFPGVLLLLLFASSASAQTPVPPAGARPRLSFDGRLVFYGDDTEFSNEFRTGETLLGTFGTAVLDADLNDRVTIRAGAFGHHRFGSGTSFDEARPVLAIVIRGPRSRIVLGTLETLRRADGPGPDRTSAHGLLPPLQRETLAFDRPFEAGLQWLVDSPRFAQDAWIHWQRRNSSTQRELFDAGIAQAMRLRPEFVLRHQVHVVHQGGQLGGAPDPVADSVAAAAGVDVGGPVGRLDRLGLEFFAVGSRYVPDRGRPADAQSGFGTFVRLSIARAPWRLHAILWRADEFIKVEGDGLYQSLRRDGSRYHALRDYGEAGLSRTFRLADDSLLEASLRVHRAERAFDYSFRILAVTRVRVPVGH